MERGRSCWSWPDQVATKKAAKHSSDVGTAIQGLSNWSLGAAALMATTQLPRPVTAECALGELNQHSLESQPMWSGVRSHWPWPDQVTIMIAAKAHV